MAKNRLLRYTNLPVLIDILSKQELTLLNPISWDDRNDSYYLEVYKTKKNLKTLLALCFSTKSETYHHWSVFSEGSSGVCIQFNKEKLLISLELDNIIKSDYVIYKMIRDLESRQPLLEELPFLKRYAYKDEEEFRIIYCSNTDEMETKSIGIDIGCIDKIILSPWIPDPVVDTVKKVIKNIPECSNIKINKTRIIESKVWKDIAKRKLNQS